MPQLMPLNWMFSSMMMLIVIVSLAIIYSEKMMINEVNMSLKGMKKSMNIWCW
uniref:ATP synthase F0 subunit 8 n=1 Tax=Neoscona adianta TaxID=1112440 RepID=A0A140AU55_9ARAC|nr:ATP synthase F0 subunit 8 [Neoscona adianta]ALF63162.1 ATP synthase F0 subunit 8 [Neoscona adianta]